MSIPGASLMPLERARMCVRLVWDEHVREFTVPSRNPLVRIVHMFASAFDADGMLCGRFEMKAVRCARSEPGDKNSRSSGCTLIELQETTACSGQAAATTQSASVAVDASAMEPGANEEDQILLKNLLGSATSGGTARGKWM